MLFNSYIFLFLFLPLALAGWYLLNRFRQYKLAQGYLIGMSLWFYAYYNVSFLWVITGSCLFNYGISFLLHRKNTPQMRRIALVVGCIGNLGALGYFKYCNFFLENINSLFHADFQLKNILLPLGISFFTFQQLSYLIDRCRGEAPHYGLLDYLSFVTFFPVPDIRADRSPCGDGFPVPGFFPPQLRYGKLRKGCDAVHAWTGKKGAACGYPGACGKLWL